MEFLRRLHRSFARQRPFLLDVIYRVPAYRRNCCSRINNQSSCSNNTNGGPSWDHLMCEPLSCFTSVSSSNCGGIKSSNSSRRLSSSNSTCFSSNSSTTSIRCSSSHQSHTSTPKKIVSRGASWSRSSNTIERSKRIYTYHLQPNDLKTSRMPISCCTVDASSDSSRCIFLALTGGDNAAYSYFWLNTEDKRSNYRAAAGSSLELPCLHVKKKESKETYRKHLQRQRCWWESLSSFSFFFQRRINMTSVTCGTSNSGRCIYRSSTRCEGPLNVCGTPTMRHVSLKRSRRLEGLFSIRPLSSILHSNAARVPAAVVSMGSCKGLTSAAAVRVVAPGSTPALPGTSATPLRSAVLAGASSSRGTAASTFPAALVAAINLYFRVDKVLSLWKPQQQQRRAISTKRRRYFKMRKFHKKKYKKKLMRMKKIPFVEMHKEKKTWKTYRERMLYRKKWRRGPPKKGSRNLTLRRER